LRANAHQPIEFDDLWQGEQRCEPSQRVDVVLRRRDRLHAYPLAVVVDDADQGVTEVIRGADLLSSTATQILLQQALALPRPRYGHLPVLVEADGGKLSKSRHATPLATDAASRSLIVTLERLRQHPPPALHGAPVREIWQWASANWQSNALTGLRQVSLDTAGV
jgi:glutamyl-Q tRNA(Asp) synthetase